MIKKKTTLVLGAGSSAPYGFPLGSELRLRILDASSDILHAEGQISEVDFENFKQAFRNSRLYSIDAFLAARPEMVEIGKMTIAGILLSFERDTLSKLSANEQDWYDYLWNRLASGRNWDDLSFDNLAVVTFNYDRSFEHFLLLAMMGTYDKSIEQAAEKLEQLQVVHVYGDIGSPLPQSPGYQIYGKTVTYRRVRDGAARLKVIPEAREDEPSLLKAQRLLLEAEAVCFLGFGFDRTNMQRLDSKRTCYPFHEMHKKSLTASCLGLTQAEAEEAAGLCHLHTAGHWRSRFIDGNCLETLRRTLILE
ncbi:hypothetical protein ACLBKS_02740 [Hylemonella sp. W303a]|uniref:hypothetical protein n=1 Tax=Hylemonella sp. W303a TaxID=3389873 RepID=UPI00396B1316